MPPVIKQTPNRPGKLIPFVLLLGAILTVLFIKSFLPNYVHFSNDGPLAVQMSKCFKVPEAFTGVWDDLNWVGFNLAVLPVEFTSIIKLLLGPVGYAKFLAPIALLIFGFCAWVFLRRMKFVPIACTLGALAAALNTTYLGTACWGVASQVIGFGMDYLALAMVVSNNATTPRWLRWLRLMLAGFAVGMGVMEGADNGAIFSMFVAAFVLFHALMEEGSIGLRFARGLGRVMVVAIFAGLIAIQTVVGLIGTQIQGMSGMGQNTESREQHWDWATQWSTPKIEVLGWVVPGLFGYRMNTPSDMPDWLQDSYKGGNYWGKVGRDPAWDRYFAGTGPEPDAQRQFLRFSGGGNYMGVLVALVALWTIAQSFRKRDSVFSHTQKRFIWFWSAAMLISMLLAFGRFAPFYRILYGLPYFSTMRNPCKFTAVFNWAVVIVFAYGIDALCRRYLHVAANSVASPVETLKGWWKKGAGGFDRKWFIGCVVMIGLSLVGWLIYSSSKDELIAYLAKVGLGDPTMGKQIASFSIRQVGWFILFLVAGVAMLAFIFSGALAGRRSRIAEFCLGAILVADLGRASLPYIVHWDYKEKYASNPIVDRLREKPYEQRVIALPFPAPPEMDLFGNVYKIEWIQQLFPYYDILSMDIVQMPRAPDVYLAFEGALGARSNLEMYKIPRRWELTSTRYLVGAMRTVLPVPDESGAPRSQAYGTLDFLNNGLDRGKGRFRIVSQFEIVAKPGIANVTQYEQLTSVEKPDGRYALFEFTGALPRVKLFNQWIVNTNNPEVLEMLASENFVPQQTVLVNTPLAWSPSPTATNQSPGEATITHYKPADITVEVNANADSVLLFSDRYDPEWKVFIDEKPGELLRCNYLMRGVAVPAGKHTLEFRFRPSMKPGFVTTAMMGLALLLSGFMIYSERRTAGREVSKPDRNDAARGNNKNPHS